MSLALAIASATGLVPQKDFRIDDDGAGPFLAWWNPANGPAPSDKELADYLAAFEANADERDAEAKLKSLAMDYLVAFVKSKEYGDDTDLTAVKAQLPVLKSVDPSPIDPVTP